MIPQVNSIVTLLVVGAVIIASTAAWYMCLNQTSKVIRLLHAMIATSAQFMVEIYATVDPSPIKIHNIPYLHVIAILALLFLKRSTFKKNYRDRKSEINPHDAENFGAKINFIFFRANIAQITCFLIGVATLVGFYPALLGGPSTVDERAYHWPQILGMIQADRFTSFDSSLPWTYAYPLGNASIAAFTWPWVGSDLAFRVPQILFGTIVLISLYILGSIRSKKVGILAALLISASPVFAVMLRMSSDDLGYGAFTLACVTLLLQASLKKDNESEKNFYFGILSMVLAGHFKYPLVNFIIALPLIAYNIIRIESDTKTLLKYRLAALFGFFTSSIYAIRNFVTYGNPFYPLEFKVLNFSIFKGPHPEINRQNLNPSTTFNINEPFGLPKTWAATFFDWFQVPNEDSLGSYNFLASSLIVGLVVFTLFKIKNMEKASQILYISVLVAIALFPVAFIPRYGFFLIGIILIFVLQTFQTQLEKSKIFLLLIFAGYLGITPILAQNTATKNWVYSQLEDKSPFINGQSAIEEKYSLSEDGGVPFANTVAWIKQNVKAKELLCYTAATRYPSLYWNNSRTSRVKFVPIDEMDRYPNNDNVTKTYTSDKLNDWISSNAECDYLVLYKNSILPTLNTEAFNMVALDKYLMILVRL